MWVAIRASVTIMAKLRDLLFPWFWSFCFFKKFVKNWILRVVEGICCLVNFQRNSGNKICSHSSYFFYLRFRISGIWDSSIGIKYLGYFFTKILECYKDCFSWRIRLFSVLLIYRCGYTIFTKGRDVWRSLIHTNKNFNICGFFDKILKHAISGVLTVTLKGPSGMFCISVFV